MKNRSYNELLDDIIEKAFSDAFSSQKEKVEPSVEGSRLYESIEEYEEKTGKRFRKTKTETQDGLTREDAFNQRFTNTGEN